jgi:hypothetical protein
MPTASTHVLVVVTHAKAGYSIILVKAQQHTQHRNPSTGCLHSSATRASVHQYALLNVCMLLLIVVAGASNTVDAAVMAALEAGHGLRCVDDNSTDTGRSGVTQYYQPDTWTGHGLKRHCAAGASARMVSGSWGPLQGDGLGQPVHSLHCQPLCAGGDHAYYSASFGCGYHRPCAEAPAGHDCVVDVPFCGSCCGLQPASPTDTSLLLTATLLCDMCEV